MHIKKTDKIAGVISTIAVYGELHHQNGNNKIKKSNNFHKNN